MSNSHSLAKVALLTQMQSLFPVGGQLSSMPERWDDAATVTRWDHQQHEMCMLPYWKGLACAYQQALAVSMGSDSKVLATQIEDWPESFAAQQKSLYELLETSKLRLAWRSYCAWNAVQKTPFTDGQQKVLAELEREEVEGSCPIVEIPLYHGCTRDSCQQLICMPVAAWHNMYSREGRYEPNQIDRMTVERLATRVAQVFNTPPLAPVELLKHSPSWSDAVMWPTSQRGLTCPINSHGMTDRVSDEYGRPKNASAPMLFPEWRYRGFGGQIRVTLEDGTPWYVTVLAPAHFVRRLMIYATGFERAATTDAPPAPV